MIRRSFLGGILGGIATLLGFPRSAPVVSSIRLLSRQYAGSGKWLLTTDRPVETLKDFFSVQKQLRLRAGWKCQPVGSAGSNVTIWWEDV